MTDAAESETSITRVSSGISLYIGECDELLCGAMLSGLIRGSTEKDETYATIVQLERGKEAGSRTKCGHRSTRHFAGEKQKHDDSNEAGDNPYVIDNMRCEQRPQAVGRRYE